MKAGGRFAARKSDLAENALVRESFQEPLHGKVVVPKLGETLVLFVHLMKAVIAVTDEPAPLLDTYEVIYPVLREATDYVKRSISTWLRHSVDADLVFALLNIVRNSSRTDIRSA